MEQQTPSTPQSSDPPPPPPSQPSSTSPSSSSLPPPSSTASSSSNPNPNSAQNPSPNPNPNPIPTPRPVTPLQQPFQQQQSLQSSSQISQPPPQSVQNPQTRPPFNNRNWSHFGGPLPSASSVSAPSSLSSGSSVPPSSGSSSTMISVPPLQRGGIAIGIPAHHPTPSPPPPQSAPFSSLNPPSFGQPFGGLGRNAVNAAESVSSSSTSQVRQPIQGFQTMGMMGSLGSGSLGRPGGVSTHHQLRPVQPSVRPSTPNTTSSATQNFQGHSLLRVSSAGSPGSLSPSTSQSMPSHNQPWLSSGSQGKPPLPSPSSSGAQGKPLSSPSFRPQMNPQSLQQRAHISQQHHPSLGATSQQQQSQQSQQPSSSHQQENNGQQFAPFRAPHTLPHHQHITRVQGAGNQKPSSLTMIQPSASQTGTLGRTSNAESGESCNTILSKRSIHELVNQIDPSEKLDPEVEDILVDLAEDFLESITTFGCSLAKHRKSSTLEAKDILLHLEKNWNMTLPGFSGDEIKNYRKPVANDMHRERLAAIKKSAETANTKSFAGQAVGSAKGLAKASANAMES